MKIKKFLSLGIAALMALSIGGLAACGSSDEDPDSGTTGGTTDSGSTSGGSTDSGSTSGGSTDSGSTSGGSTSGGSTSTTKETITVWCSETDGVSTLFESQLAAYVSDYEANTGTEFGYQFNVVGVSEGDAASNMITDVTAGADIFCFAQDQLYRLVEAGALSQVSSTYASYVEANNDAGSVSAGTVGDVLYAYPLTSDNGYFMYYDKSVLSESDIANQTDLIAACAAAGKKIGFQLSEDGGWYNAAYFFGAGCVSNWTFEDTGAVKSYSDTYNSAEGLIALQGMAELINSGSWVNVSAASNLDADGACAVVVSGTWDYSKAVEILGDNLGCAKLWSYTVNGTDYQLGSFSGNKLIGVKPQTDATKLAVCQSLAYYLTNETCQSERLEELGWGPSNTTVQASDAVASNPALAALAAQAEYATPQGNYPDAWWTAAATMGASVSALNTTTPTTEQLQAILTTYQATLDSIANPTYEGWIAVGNLSGDTSWNSLSEVFQLTYEGNTYANKSSSDVYTGIWTLTVTIEDASDNDYPGCGYIAFIHYGSWDVQYGGGYLDAANSYSGCIAKDDTTIVVPVGTYTVTFDTTGEKAVITIVQA